MATLRKTADPAPPGTGTLAQRYLTSADVFAEERVRIFSTRWICVGHASALADGGDYLVREVAGESVLIVRDHGGDANAFYNVCRHRGTRLAEATQGRFPNFIRCPYHAWTYGLDGRLIGAPHMREVPGFAAADYPLHAVALAQWDGFLFVNLTPGAAPLEASLAPLWTRFGPWNMSRLRSARRIEYDVAANWKLIFENYSECYHCPLVHPDLAKLTPYDAAVNDLSEGPVLGGYMPMTQAASMTVSGKRCAPLLGDLGPADEHRVYYYAIFPNLLLSVHPDYVLVHTVWPQAADRVRIACEWLFHADAFGRADFNPDDAVAFWDKTNRQDWHVCELSQAGIASRTYQPGPYSPRERISAAFDAEYLQVMENVS